jgi:hypothetical protein
MQNDNPTKRHTLRRDDSATSRLFKDAPKAHALHLEGKRLRREQARKEWYSKHGGAK